MSIIEIFAILFLPKFVAAEEFGLLNLLFCYTILSYVGSTYNRVAVN